MAVRLLMICGLKFVIGKQEGFIVGGEYVNSIKDFAHVAAIVFFEKNFGESFCGSSILNQKILLTAAHCLITAENITAHAGTLDKYKGNIRRVDRFKLHKQFHEKEFVNDMALLRLKKPLSLGKTMKRVILMKKLPKVKMAEVAGWGSINEEADTSPKRLKYTTQKLWTHKQCKKVLKIPEVPDYQLPNGTFCGGEMKAQGNYPSHGDSGSGLTVNKNRIIGIVSFKVPSLSRSLMIYTDVSYYYKWIKVESRRLACS
ncbi:trypsin Tyr p 3.0101-like [Leguminivora glycinivorella]|uniref:trypsin Tyr p 3.0101-like n=1 Tax=Leguminivora glycinivorella TaxID=1035111 RepID=UPI00200E51A4|nr:trypsin Tyr p 3.0101-like [Leguminivora glycinivorella]